MTIEWLLRNVALVETLVAKTRAWEEDRGLSFAYDGVPLLAMLDEYAMLRHDREEEKRRMRVSPVLLKLKLISRYINVPLWIPKWLRSHSLN